MYLDVFISLLLRGVLGGYYEGNWWARRRSVDTPGRGVLRDPLYILRAEIFVLVAPSLGYGIYI